MSNLKEHDDDQAAITAACEAGTCGHPECVDLAAKADDFRAGFVPFPMPLDPHEPSPVYVEGLAVKVYILLVEDDDGEVYTFDSKEARDAMAADVVNCREKGDHDDWENLTAETVWTWYGDRDSHGSLENYWLTPYVHIVGGGGQ